MMLCSPCCTVHLDILEARTEYLVTLGKAAVSTGKCDRQKANGSNYSWLTRLPSRLKNRIECMNLQLRNSFGAHGSCSGCTADSFSATAPHDGRLTRLEVVRSLA